MNRLICGIFLSASILFSIVACTAAPATALPPANVALTIIPTQSPVPRIVNTPVAMSVTPFYNSEGPLINVGEYSQRLGDSDLEALTILSQEMLDQKQTLTPEQMYVLAIRFYDLGEKDAAVYWFYEAQFRAKLFQLAIEPAQMVRVGEPTFELTTAYDSFQKLAGDFINGYAGCDLDNWIRITTQVMNDNPNPPELDQMFPEVVFVERGQWQGINNNVATGLAVLINYISENGELIQRQRAQQNLDQYCN